MIVVPVKEGENIERALKKFKKWSDFYQIQYLEVFVGGEFNDHIYFKFDQYLIIDYWKIKKMVQF